MITCFVGEERDGRIKFTTDRDCLSPQIIRFDVRYFPTMAHLCESALTFEARGFRVCIDTEDGLYETGDDSGDNSALPQWRAL